jgi:hypothetical protein
LLLFVETSGGENKALTGLSQTRRKTSVTDGSSWRIGESPNPWHVLPAGP